MTPDEYRGESLRRSPMTGSHAERVTLYALGLSGETGEVCDEIKKVLFHGRKLDTRKILDECGDVYWYLDRMVAAIGFTMEECMEANSEKLAKRYPDGFKLEADR